ncbi:N-acetyllactosaminide beta-1,3-N-acetylglucosaminyltransferase 3-like [Thalassophryne amazonica]|uniref:N-acetyllactosaminide beta-1,3-N-acetylglucosaminyltransferase 3-like n=1 Tax=Thalassophryne amazonica TaxID=390379 RepID=UPI001471365F|nr:N-acetyllactosaminide beta-1,3-N-acetylglucosaminyltransferase 3-like [Thalassophryne amazonica]XP_034035927.1 N-acetyllactosaminide beta-1,3-N-acetylglucosaminyltransferase 3-like [Thalassophryne amazonica]XP_034035928.1 N-acetyllactosaminide beta-1,3-N-acetylglucosaminyltransferase 3-like [Thalassophryne amazonica]
MRIIKAVTLLLIAACGVSVLHLWKVVFTNYATDHHLIKKDTIKKSPPTSKNSNSYSSPKCEQNMSAASITDFSSLPVAIQEFLYYRHCRHFPMLLDVPDKCGQADRSSNVFLLLVIKSSPANYERREVLRKTWAKERLHNGMWIRRTFIMGTTAVGFEKERLNMVLELEQQDHNDILQWDFNDSLYNLTLKQILFLEWMERNCPNVRFLLNGDDDVFAHTDNMVEYLLTLEDNNGSKHLFAGYVFQDTKPVRWSKSKYFIPVQVQESDVYPPYCGGGGFLMSGYTALVIYNMSHSIAIHPIDDAYMGMCLAKAGLAPISHIGFRTLGLEIPSKRMDTQDPCFYVDLLLVHRFLPVQIFLMWHRIHEPNLKCGVNRHCFRRKGFRF